MKRHFLHSKTWWFNKPHSIWPYSTQFIKPCNKQPQCYGHISLNLNLLVTCNSCILCQCAGYIIWMQNIVGFVGVVLTKWFGCEPTCEQHEVHQFDDGSTKRVQFLLHLLCTCTCNVVSS